MPPLIVAPTRAAGPTTRVAPTPSGYVHLGNAVNFLLTGWWARAHGARLILRIDDFDMGRVRPDYLADIFATLDWLGLTPSGGPRDPDEFDAAFSLQRRLDPLRRARDQLLSTQPDAAFVCRCSRTQLDASGRCTAGCREARLGYQPGASVVRLSVPPGTQVRVGGTTSPVPTGDHVMWRRDDLPAYQLGSVVRDEELGVTAIIRGSDLLASSALQVHLASLLPAPGFLSADLMHHALLTDDDGLKLSKSAGAQGRPMRRDAAALARVHELAAMVGLPLGITPP